jgi:hypothetical protein
MRKIPFMVLDKDYLELLEQSASIDHDADPLPIYFIPAKSQLLSILSSCSKLKLTRLSELSEASTTSRRALNWRLGETLTQLKEKSRSGLREIAVSSEHEALSRDSLHKSSS